ncbi:25096_t:CDS:1, partial [Racocetra persica]
VASNSLTELKSTLNKIIKLAEEYKPVDISFYIDILKNNVVVVFPPKDDKKPNPNLPFINALRPYKLLIIVAKPSKQLIQKRRESSGGIISGMILSGDGIAN